jgi:hypothetical protein
MKVMIIMHIVMPNADDAIMEQWRLFLSDGFEPRKAFTKRVNKAVIWSKQNEFPENGHNISLLASSNIENAYAEDVVEIVNNRG